VVGKYMVLYRSSATAEEQMAQAQADPGAAAAAMELWTQWGAKVGDALVDFGSPLNESAIIPTGGGNVTAHIGGYSIMQADSAAEVTALLEGHPHFHAPDASIEVLEVLPAPGMA
jgi:hypothetical protein